MAKIVVALPQDRNLTGLLKVEEDNGRTLAGPFAVSGRADDRLAASQGNPTRNPLLPYGDTPLGSYRVSRLLETGKGTIYDASTYGRHGAVVLEAKSGDAVLAEANGRFHVLIHGGVSTADGKLRATNGCLRLSDPDQKKLISILRRWDNIVCECVQASAIPGSQSVICDSEYNEPDPSVLPPATTSNQVSVPSHQYSRREFVQGVAATALVLSTPVFLWTQSIEPARAQTNTYATGGIMLALSSNSVIGGDPVTLTVSSVTTSNGVTPIPVTVTLTCNDPSVTFMPNPVDVPAATIQGTSFIPGTVQVTVSTVPVQTDTTVTIEGLDARGDSATVMLTIRHYNWQDRDVSVGSDNKARVLWNNTNGQIALWTVDNNGAITNGVTYGPYPGWTASAISSGADGVTRVLWNNTNGTQAIWWLAADNSLIFGATYGPLAGWTITDITVGSDNKARVLWNNENGEIALWTVDNRGAITNGVTYGPFPGWTASHISSGADGVTRVLWDNINGEQAIWWLAADNSLPAGAGATYGPLFGWTITDITVGSDNKARVLWSSTSGEIALWTVDNNGAITNGVRYGPYPGWTASAISSGADGVTRVLWNHTDGRAGLWFVNQDNNLNNGFTYGPF